MFFNSLKNISLTQILQLRSKSIDGNIQRQQNVSYSELFELNPHMINLIHNLSFSGCKNFRKVVF